MKFILVMQICSLISGHCDQAMAKHMLYNSFHECSIAGHLNSLKVLQNLGTEITNVEQTVVMFWCKKTNPI